MDGTDTLGGVSSLWTPDGEYPVGRKADAPSQPVGAPQDGPAAPTGPAGPGGEGGEPELSEEQLREAEAYMQALARTPARVVIVNHVVSIFQLAQIHLAADPPRFEDARLAIDGAGALVDTLGDRLGEEGKELADATAQLRMAFVQMQAALGKQGNGGAPESSTDHLGEPRH